MCVSKQRCCLCLKLRTGAYVFAAISIIMQFCNFLRTTFLLGVVGGLHELRTRYDELDFKHSGVKPHPRMSISLIYMLLITNLIVAGLQIFLDTMLIRGIRNNRLPVLKFWMLFKSLLFVLNILTLGLEDYDVVRQKEHADEFNVAVDAILIVVGSIYTIFFIVAVYFLHKEMKTKCLPQPKPRVAEEQQFPSPPPALQENPASLYVISDFGVPVP